MGRALYENPRIAKLIARVDDRFNAFIASLPSPLKSLAFDPATYSGKQEETTFEGVSQFNPILVGGTWLFFPLFADLDDGLIVSIAEAGAYPVLASILFDHLLDGQARSPGWSMLLQKALQNRGEFAFRSIFPAESPFWGLLDRLSHEHLLGLIAEVAAQEDPGSLNAEVFHQSARAKIAPSLIPLGGLAIMADRPSLLNPIEESMKWAIQAGQLYDDLGDWREDLQAGHLTYFLRGLARDDPWEASSWPAEETLEHRIDSVWQDVETLRKVVEWFNSAQTAVGDLECPGWKAYLDGCITHADSMLTAMLARHLLRSVREIVA
jgi:hypothetical protein